MTPRVRPRATSEVAEPRTIARYRREVVALLRAGHGIPSSRGTLLVKRWDRYVRARWLQGKPPCNVADHIGKFEREKLVKPARDQSRKHMTRTAFASQMSPVGGSRRASRDADNPHIGETYETRGGSRWQVVSTTDKLVTVKRAGHRTEGPYAWGRSSLRGMKQVPKPLFGVGGLFGIGAGKSANVQEVGGDPDTRRRRRVHKGLWGLAKRAHKRVSDFSPRALAKGIRVEMEHTEQRSVARRIAMDHLTEDPRYYDKLARMEQGGYGRDPSRRKRAPAKKTAKKAPRKSKKSEGAHCSATPILARKARKIPPPRTCPSSTKVQSLVFERHCWTLPRARSWVKRHGYKTEVDTSERYYRFRQLAPRTYKPVGTVPFMRGLNAIMGCARTAKKTSSRTRVKKTKRDPSPSILKRFPSHEAALRFANKNLGFAYRMVDKAPGRMRLQGEDKRYTLIWPSN
jgi:hypothetical protein